MIDHANVVIIGGGIVGCSTAYHLSKMGCQDIVVIEKGELTSGSTWHAAGLVGQLRSSRNITQMLKLSVELYENLEKETGQPTGWERCGCLRVASTPERMNEFRKAATTAKSFGLEMHLLTPSEARELYPIMETKDLVGASFMPTDGQADPSMITHALAKGARSRGVRFIRNTLVKDIETKNKSATAVVTDQGTIKADIIVNCAGMWARKIGNLAGVNVPLIPVEHQYMVSEPIANLPKGLPTLRDPDSLIYYKEEMGGLVMGGYEPNPIPWSINGIPKTFGQELLESNFDHFEQLAEKALHRTPCLAESGVRKLVNGPESFTTDGYFIMGEAPEVKNFFVGAGFNAHGIAAGGGAGQMLAEWIYHGKPSLDLWAVDIRRFGKYHRSLEYVKDRTLELYGKHYTISWPYEEHESARGVKLSPLYDKLKEQGAIFGSKFGWERPNWFLPKGEKEPSFTTFERPEFFKYVANEHRAIRERVALIDQTSFSKFKISGKDACSFLNWIADNDVDKANGSLTYTQFCNKDGGIEADLTIARLSESEFYLVTGTAFGTHDLHWMKTNIPEGSEVHIEDVTDQYGVINVCGPHSRKLLQRITDYDMSHDNFKFATCAPIQILDASILALRVTYVGELGWELHIPIEKLAQTYDTLWKNGEDLGICNAGYFAIESTRLEKGYRYWSADIGPDYTPHEAGLGFCAALEKEKFIGKEAIAKQKREGVKRRLVTLTVDKPLPIYGGETICRNGEVLGVVTSGGYGFTVEKTIVFGYLNTEQISEQPYELEVMGKVYQAKRETGSLYDPKRARILC